MSQLLNPNWDRLNFIPWGWDKRTGKGGLAVPQVAADLLSAVMLPGDVYQGNVLLRDEGGQLNPEVIRRSADLAGAVTLGSGAVPGPANSLRAGAKIRRELPPVKPSSDDVWEVASANMTFGDVVGNRTMPLNKVYPSGTGATPDQAARVSKLMEKIQGPEGYISRIIVDDKGNIIEGQHRYEALKNLGYDKVPVTVIRDKASGMDIEKARAAIRSVGKLRSDHENQIIEHAINMVAEAGSPQKALDEFELPKGFEAQFRAVLESMK